MHNLAQNTRQNTATYSSLIDRVIYSGNNLNGRHVNVYGGCLFSGGGGNGQELHMKYDESSTEDNPVIKAWGIDSKGNAYKQLIYVNDVDPQNATPAEMKALEEHLRKTGDKVISSPGSRGIGFIMSTLGGFDVNEKLNFIQYMNEGASRTLNKSSALRSRLDAERYLFYFQQHHNN